MADIFLNIVNMSISASWVVFAVLLLRLLLKKAPKWITVLLWGVVAVRLICPFSIESVMSLIPSTETISPEIMMDKTPTINSGVPIINNIVNPVIGESFAPDPIASANPLQILIPVLAIAWVVGIFVMLAYTVISYFRVKSKIGTAVILRDNIYQSENVVSPFVLGIIKPKIYLPFNMNEQDVEHVVAHENTHIRRKDHWWKPFGFLVLTLHWFNPLMWLGYVLLCRDIELACDEKVVKEFNNDQKANYSQALLTCSVRRRIIAACPLAFGEVDVKSRVKYVLNYKKPSFWVVTTAIVACIVVAVCFLTNPRTSIDDELSVFLDMQIAERHYSEEHTDDNFIVTHHKALGVDRTLKGTTVYMWVLYHEYSYKNGEIKLEAGAHIPTVITAKRTGSHGHYELVEYWEPRDGSYYADDIREKFPWHLHGKALDSEMYIDEQLEFCNNAAKEYFNEANKTSSTHNRVWHSDFPGIYVQVLDITNKAEQETLLVSWNNETEHTVTYGERFWIERLENGEWIDCSLAEINYYTIGYMLDASDVEQKEYTLTNNYDLSKPGTYRFCSTCSIDVVGEKPTTCSLWTEFIVE